MENEQKNTPPTQTNAKKSAAMYMLFELGIEFAVILALPLLAFIYAGKWLDNKWHTKFMVIIGILLALFLSSYLIYKKINDVRKLLK